jgi:hypothetical protein
MDFGTRLSVGAASRWQLAQVDQLGRRSESRTGPCLSYDQMEEVRAPRVDSLEAAEAAIYKSHTISLNDPELYLAYQMSRRKHFDCYSVVPVVVLFYFAVITRFSLGNIGSDGPLFTAAFALLAVGSVVFFNYITARLIVHFTPKRMRHCNYYQLSERNLSLCYRWRIEDVIGILGTVIIGLYLLAKVWAGPCKDSDDLWATQRCNPFANVGAIPHDQVILLYLSPLMTQCIFQGISGPAVLICWSLNLFFVIVSAAHVGGFLEIWTILYSILFMNISFMIERLMRVTFVEGRAALAAVTTSIEHERGLLEVSIENERLLKEKEIYQLRSLMGNVAHDLKTPLHSIEAYLEVLSAFISKIPRHILEGAIAEFGSNGLRDDFNHHSIFDSLNATCKFMGMAINRSQDFMKASNNIALVTAMETFELASAVNMAVTCMTHL